ncbi:hypothetical protein BpHYR1_040454 [Brachionus plicatilis]|uniref:Uncharacterized protein n=1 Tax=Brachionus plicatilis TaxID=10195 RepID=A0A3M7S864_BRAPC|nr:hypothetical protein BpHYR1_040454 [Brachionus plicatilis]
MWRLKTYGSKCSHNIYQKNHKIRSNIDYGSILFAHISEYCKQRLQGIQYSCLRLILKKLFAYSSSLMHEELKIKTLVQSRLNFSLVELVRLKWEE